MYNTLRPSLKARYVRIIPTQWNKHISMRIELFGCTGNRKLFVAFKIFSCLVVFVVFLILFFFFIETHFFSEAGGSIAEIFSQFYWLYNLLLAFVAVNLFSITYMPCHVILRIWWWDLTISLSWYLASSYRFYTGHWYKAKLLDSEKVTIRVDSNLSRLFVVHRSSD